MKIKFIRCKTGNRIFHTLTTHLQHIVTRTNAVDFSLFAEHGLPGGCRHQTQVFLKRDRKKTCSEEFCWPHADGPPPGYSQVSTCRSTVSATFFSRPSLTMQKAVFCLMMALVSFSLMSSRSCFDCLTASMDVSKACLHSATTTCATCAVTSGTCFPCL